MRLIDGDKLKREFPKDSDWDYPVNTNSYVCEMIDKMPTIETEWKNGKWTYIDEAMFGNPHGSYKCSVCDNRMPYKTNFCQRCGADMRGDAEKKEDVEPMIYPQVEGVTPMVLKKDKGK